ncbi:MAG: F0F1 ATP synthase subunit B' [Paracoccus sp. (in: a-proteobacteria)]
MFSLLEQTTITVVEIETTTTTVVGADATHGASVAAGHGADAAATPGMPQLNPEYFGNLIFWLLVTLAVLYWVLSKVALPRIGAVLSDRQGVITGDLMQAEEFKKKAKDAEAAYDKALVDARTEANKIIAAQKADIQKELDAAVTKADADIAARTAESEKRIGVIRESAVADARTVARDITAELIRAFGGKADDNAAIDAAIDVRLKGTS